MEERRLVVLFGDSLLMDTVEASLGDNPELGVMRIHINVADVGERLKSLSPDLVIVDLNALQVEFVISFLKDQPGIPLLGLDVTCSKVVVLSSQHYAALTSNDLVRVIQELATPKIKPSENYTVALVKGGNGSFGSGRSRERET